MAALGHRLHRLRVLDTGLRTRARRTAHSAGLAAGEVHVVVGVTVLAEIVVGLLATRSGALPGATAIVPALLALAVLDPTGRPAEVVRAVGRGLEAEARLRSLHKLPVPREDAGWFPLPRGPLRLEVTGLSVRWPDAPEPALRDVDLTLRPGRRLGVVGESGAGKTTLITALLGFLPGRDRQHSDQWLRARRHRRGLAATGGRRPQPGHVPVRHRHRQQPAARPAGRRRARRRDSTSRRRPP